MLIFIKVLLLFRIQNHPIKISGHIFELSTANSVHFHKVALLSWCCHE